MMDKVSQHVFERLVQMDATALTEADREFLKARKSYMSPEQRLKFTTFLDEVSQGEPLPPPGTPQAELADIKAAMEAEAEMHAAARTLSPAHERALDQALTSEKQRQEVTKTILKSAEQAEEEAAERAEADRKAEEKASKKAEKEAEKAAKKNK
jgi:hypothetical protein